MKKFTFGGEKTPTVGHLISSGKDLSFDLKDAKGKNITLAPRKGLTIISVIPLLNTEKCDEQSMWMAKKANIYKEVSFVTLTADSPKIINDWCNTRHYSNLKIYSDYKRDFGNKTNTLLKKKDFLARGFIIFKDSDIVQVSFKPEVKDEVDYSIAEAFLEYK